MFGQAEETFMLCQIHPEWRNSAWGAKYLNRKRKFVQPYTIHRP